MYKLLLIGIEKALTNDLSKSIPWNSYEIGEILEAPDGVAALNIIIKCKPDIVITDLRMQAIDCMKLSPIIKKNSNDIIVILVIENEVFPIAKKTSNFNRFGYLHKPITKEELESVIQNAVEQLNQNKKSELTGNNTINKTADKNSLFTRMISGYQEVESIKSELVELEINMNFADYFITVFTLSEKSKEICKKLEFDMRLLNVELSNILDELCNGVVHDYAISTYCGFNIVLAVDGLKKESDIVKQLFYNVKKFIKENFDIDIVIGISENYHGLGKISDAYHEAYEQVIKQKYCGYTDTKNIEQTLINKMFMENKKKLIKSIYACDNACAHGIIDLIFDMEFMTGIPVKQIKSMNALLLNGLISVVSDIDYDINEDMGYSKSVYKRLSELRNLENSKQFLNDIIDELIASLKERNIEMKSDLIKSILAYVDENYNKDIKLYAIAEKFNIDSRTLSGLFNEDVGKQFSKYMIEFKINKAKQLLCNTQLKVYEIGEHIGYSDIKYFSKIFKELEGVTPTEYKKRHVKNAS